ncbi:MAG: glycoside hydrolase family 57 protein [Verrucomicrobiota bacterium]
MSAASQTLPVTLLWHMHQPYYVDPQTKMALMPWVRFHAVKGYFDMITTVQRFPELKVNFNFTPVLLRQIREMVEDEVVDLWESWARTPASDLNEDQQCSLLENYFKINHETCIHPYPRYAQLLNMRGADTDRKVLRQTANLFSVDDYRDLQVWYNLAWCGFAACQEYPELNELKKKGKGFTEEEKHRLLDIHQEILKVLTSRYQQSRESGNVEITTTPYFHPIMPLVYDTDFGKRAMPDREFPPRFQAPDDVRAHLMNAQKEHELAFGAKARGLWPSEGSVAPELIPLFEEAGIEYFCTDEDVLFNSLPNGTDHLELFQPWVVEHDGKEVGAFFRERPLSDFIGFNAARNTAEQSSDHLIHHLEHLSDVVQGPERMVCLALDGENAWEAFMDGGEAFLEIFYQSLLKSTKLETQRLGDLWDRNEAKARIKNLHTGSWISANFDIWIGEKEENQGWDWIRKTRADLLGALENDDLDPELRERAWDEIYAAEGSDWFWWYGPDFQNESDMLFDGLFRKHLQNAYLILGQKPPDYLDYPIRNKSEVSALVEPTGFISPALDSESCGFFDWMGAGYFDIRQQQTAMFQSDRIARDLYFGFDQNAFYFRLDLESLYLDKVVVQWLKPSAFSIETSLVNGDWISRFFRADAEEKNVSEKIVTGIGGRVLWSILLKEIHLDEGEAAFRVSVYRDGVETENYPEKGAIEFHGLSPEFSRTNWFI